MRTGLAIKNIRKTVADLDADKALTSKRCSANNEKMDAVFVAIADGKETLAEMRQQAASITRRRQHDEQLRMLRMFRMVRKWCATGNSDPRFSAPEARITAVKQTPSNQ